MLRHWRLLLSIFTRRERVQISMLLMSTTILALIEVCGIASIMPFIAIVVQPSLIDTNPILQALYERAGFDSHREFQFFLGAVSFALLIVSNAFTAFDAWFTFRFCYLRSHMLATRLLARFMNQPYELFLQRSSADLEKIVITEVDRVIVGTLMAGIGLFSDVVSCGFILLVLLVIDPWVMLSTLVALGVAYGLIFLTIQKRVSRLGEEYVELSTDIVRKTSEALGGVKEIKVLGRQAAFVERFSAPKLRASINSIRHKTLDIIPIQSLEVLAFGIIIVVTLYYLATSEAAGEALSVITLYAFAAYRLLPTLKEIFDGIDTIRYNAAALEVVCADFGSAASTPTVTRAETKPVELRHGIRLDHVAYTYPGASRPAVSELDLTVPAGKLSCLVGQTGAGKSTAVDLILGLLRPNAGHILLDDRALDDASVPTWQASVGYVPQNIYLIDDSITRNIALGVSDNEIDMARVERAAQQAQIHDFIVSDLAAGYATIVGDKGIRLSGGQRQRIGIARALYRDPTVLVLDEATNALDQETESKLLRALRGKIPQPTILFVSHKISVAQRADRIFVLARGQCIAEGTYAELTRSESPHRALLFGG